MIPGAVKNQKIKIKIKVKKNGLGRSEKWEIACMGVTLSRLTRI